jgi:alkylated DNA repair dioxygenase AlkB
MHAGTRYSYTNISREGKGWPQFLAELKAEVEAVAQQRFNFVFCNLYDNQDEYIGWYGHPSIVIITRHRDSLAVLPARHQDKEEVIVKRSTIATVSLGAPRRFCLRHDKTKRISQVSCTRASLSVGDGRPC